MHNGLRDRSQDLPRRDPIAQALNNQLLEESNAKNE
jgi:hypothetical protein